MKHISSQKLLLENMRGTILSNTKIDKWDVAMIEYDKLIRDKIPEIIENSGKKCIVEEMDTDTYIRYLDIKLNEELAEYQSDKSLEELADLLEVIYAVTLARGYSVEELERIRKEKAEKRGGFEKRLRLKGVLDNGGKEV